MAGVMILGIVSVFTVFTPQYKRIMGLRSEVVDLSTKQQEQQAFLQGIERKLAQLATEAGHERELALVLPNTSDLDDVLRVIDRAAAASGVVLATVTNNGDSLAAAERAAKVRGEAALPPKVTPLGVSISATGSYQQLRQFTDTVAASIRLIDIVRVQFTAAENAAADILGAELELRFYRYQE